MRVLEIMGSLHRGGAETMIMNFYRAFDKQLCQMDFIVHAEFIDDYRQEAELLGAKVILLSRPGQVGARKYICELTNAIVNNGPYDAVHIHTNYQAFLAVIAAKRAGISKIIVHSHTTNFKRHEIVINRIVMKHFRTKNIACGMAAGDAFFGKNNYIVLNNAIDITRFTNTDKESVENQKKAIYSDCKIIGHLGSFTLPKNHQFIIKFAKELSKCRSDFKVLLYGEGEYEKDIQKLIADYNLVDIVMLCGVTNDAPKAYKMFDLFILPSIYEGFPVTLVEAQISGTYCLASTNISSECDLGIDRLEYLDLNVNEWAERVDVLLDQNKTDMDNISVDQFDVNVKWKELYSIYKR